MTERDHTAHLSPDTLADLQEGLLDAAGETSARRHLESCADCRADLAALTALPGLLAAAADVGPVPDLVTHRLDRALAGVVDEPAGTGTSRTVTPFPAAHGTPRGMRLLQAAAVVVVLLGLGAVAVSLLPRTGGSDDSASTADSAGGAAERAAAEPVPITASGQDWTEDSVKVGARSMANGTLGPPVALYSAPGSSEDGSANAGGDGGSAPSAPARDLATLPAGRLADPAALRICVNRLADEDTDPIAVDLAEFKDAPAAVIVLPDPDDPASLYVYVVEPTCPVGTFLHFAHVPRS